MHIPPYHKKKSIQHFLLGAITGACIAYVIFTFMYGKMYEDILLDKIQLQTKVSELTRQKEVLLMDKEQLQEKAVLTVDSIELHFLNSEALKLDRLIIHQFEALIKQELNDVIGKESEALAASDTLLIALIENKQFTIDALTYEFEIRKLAISSKVSLTLYVKLME